MQLSFKNVARKCVFILGISGVVVAQANVRIESEDQRGSHFIAEVSGDCGQARREAERVALNDCKDFYRDYAEGKCTTLKVKTVSDNHANCCTLRAIVKGPEDDITSSETSDSSNSSGNGLSLYQVSAQAQGDCRISQQQAASIALANCRDMGLSECVITGSPMVLFDNHHNLCVYQSTAQGVQQ